MILYFINHKKFYFFLYLFKEDTMDLLNDFIFMKNFFTLFLYRIQLDQDSIEICSNITKTGKEKRRNFFIHLLPFQIINLLIPLPAQNLDLLQLVSFHVQWYLSCVFVLVLSSFSLLFHSLYYPDYGLLL